MSKWIVFVICMASVNSFASLKCEISDVEETVNSKTGQKKKVTYTVNFSQFSDINDLSKITAAVHRKPSDCLCNTMGDLSISETEISNGNKRVQLLGKRLKGYLDLSVKELLSITRNGSDPRIIKGHIASVPGEDTDVTVTVNQNVTCMPMDFDGKPRVKEVPAQKSPASDKKKQNAESQP